MSLCNICPRHCNVNRDDKAGYCSMPNTVKIARRALHFWEEPCISGKSGSGTVFFSGCNMKCVYCQNKAISTGGFGAYVSIERLANIFCELQNQGALNINLVTPTHYVLQIIEAVNSARAMGMNLPIVYNTSSYENIKAIESLKGIVDIWLADFKYFNNSTAERYSFCSNYVNVAKAAIGKMVQLAPTARFDGDGIMKKGVIIRHLVLPGHIKESKELLRYLYDKYGDSVYISIMSQYTPCNDLTNYPKINRTLTKKEYENVVDAAIGIGIENGFIQEGSAASESFIPQFDLKGVNSDISF